MNDRKVTNRLFDLLEQGVIDKDALLRACLNYMTEDEVAHMAYRYGFVEAEDIDDSEDENVDDSMDGDTASALASAGMGTDEDYGCNSDIEEY